MINIQKLKDGRKVSIAEYNLAKSEYEQVYANADENTKAKMDGLMRSSQNYSSADPMNNRSSREYATQMYKNAVKVANGEYSAALGAVTPTKNMFNGYSHSENIDNANYVTSKYLNLGKKSTSSSSSTASSSGLTFYNFKWADGLTSSYGLDTDTFQDRYGRFVDNLIKNVTNAISAKQSGKSIRGLAQQDSDQLEAILQGLVDLKARSGSLSQPEALKELLKFAGPLKIDESGFKSYFSAYLPQQTQSDKNKQARINEGYQFGSNTSGNLALDKALKTKGWTIGQLDGKRYIFDSDFNLITTPEFFVDDDYLSQGYNQYYNIGEDGSLNIGNTDDILDTDHPYYQNYQNFLTKAKERNGAIYGVNGAWDNLNSQSDNELLNAIGSEIHGKKWIDVGRYFNGDHPVIAVPKDGETIETDKYGNLKFDNLDIYYIGSDNQVYKGTKDEADQALGGFNRLGYDQTSFISAENYNLGDQQSNIDINSNYSGRGWVGNWWARFAGLNLNGEFNPFYALSPAYKLFVKDERHAAYSGNIADNPEDWAKLILNSIATDTNKELLSRFNYNSDPLSLVVILNKIIQETNMTLTPEQKQAYQMLLRRAKSQQQISSEKEGGILSAAEGNTLNIFGDPSTASAVRKKWDKKLAEADAVAQRAAERGVSEKTQVASEKQGMTASDWARVTALTMDIGSTIAAISQAGTGLFGTATSDALALGSMGVDLVADITDPSVTAGEAAKNAVINTGLGLVGFAGGGLAKLGRNLPKIAKIVTKVVAYGGAALTAMNPEIQASVKKVMESGKAGQSPMTTKDWQNVMMFLRAASGTTRGIATRAGQIKQVRKINSKSKGAAKIESTESVVDPGQEYIKVGEKQIKVTKAEKAKLEEALASKENPQAKFEEVLKTIKGAENLTPEEISSIDTSKGKLFGLIKPKVTTEGGGKKSITKRIREKVGNTAGGITDKIAGTYKTNATDAELASLMERADARAAAARRSPDKLSWTQRLLMKSDSFLGKGYTGEQIALARAANEGEGYFGKNIDLENSDKTNGTTENFRLKLQARAEAKAAAAEEAAEKTATNEAAVGTPERIKLKKEEVKDVADKVNKLVSKRITVNGKYKGRNTLARKEFSNLKNLHEDLIELAADPDVSSNPELMAQVRAAQQALESAKLKFAGARPEWWKEFGFKQGGEINLKYSHLRK